MIHMNRSSNITNILCKNFIYIIGDSHPIWRAECRQEEPRAVHYERQRAGPVVGGTRGLPADVHRDGQQTGGRH